MIHKTLHRELKSEQQELHKKTAAPEGQSVPAPIVAQIVVLLNDTNIIW